MSRRCASEAQTSQNLGLARDEGMLRRPQHDSIRLSTTRLNSQKSQSETA